MAKNRKTSDPTQALFQAWAKGAKDDARERRAAKSRQHRWPKVIELSIFNDILLLTFLKVWSPGTALYTSDDQEYQIQYDPKTKTYEPLI